MIRRLLLVLALTLFGSKLATAATASVVVTNLNLRAGPSTQFPVVTVLPAGGRVLTNGCLADYSWCDVSFGTYRGWVAARYIQVVYQGTPVIITPAVAPRLSVAVVQFSQAYWTRYYSAYPWYGRWGVYAPYYAPPPPPPAGTTVNRSGSCANGSCSGTTTVTGPAGYSATRSLSGSCANGVCNGTRTVTGPAGYSATRSRSCSSGDRSCSVTRSGPRGGSYSGTRTFNP
ncbi:SH3 domain-containing protein [uncultured Cohaesibacter sp.]|uniref:SH3 domain-containing protein n=1 Tax=uncultured Cohaesibacter sp. TaxID=1002546 RepID=UPI0029C8DA10|nr:SH3 domain-containing protein [uncultured Cohaesibacter sp.]